MKERKGPKKCEKWYGVKIAANLKRKAFGRKNVFGGKEEELKLFFGIGGRKNLPCCGNPEKEFGGEPFEKGG